MVGCAGLGGLRTRQHPGCPKGIRGADRRAEVVPVSAADRLQTHTSIVADIVAKIPTQLIIGGAQRPASDGATFDVLDPATGDTLARVASGSLDDAIASVDAACAAGKEWAQTAPRKRSEILQRTYQLMVDRVDELALLITAENGKALADARGEVLYSAEFFRWYAEEAVRIRRRHPGCTRWSEQDHRSPAARRSRPAGDSMELPSRDG